jgi:uncharacterized RDD family membrane protein YckC
VTGDRLEELWPKRNKDRQALAESSIMCYRHSRPAVLVCTRCEAPYCSRCRSKPWRIQFYCCRRCQGNHHNRRFVGLLIDGLIYNYLPLAVIIPVMSAVGGAAAQVLTYGINAVMLVLFLFRDAMFRGAGLGKRAMGLRVVRSSDGKTTLGYGQAIVRWSSQLIPVFNLVDAFVVYRDPLLRRYGDRWAKTRVIDTPRALEKARSKARARLLKRGVELQQTPGMTPERFARIDG